MSVRSVDTTTRGPSTRVYLFQGSSVGKCNKVWLKEFYHSASGASAQDWIGKPKKADRLPWPGKAGVKILFPSLGTVRESRLGEAVSFLFPFSRVFISASASQ